MLRSIADIARSEGEDLSDPESALSCVQVFALGGRAGSADASESGYFAVRGMLAKSVTEAARFIAERGVIEQGAPVVVASSLKRRPASERCTQKVAASSLCLRRLRLLRRAAQQLHQLAHRGEVLQPADRRDHLFGLGVRDDALGIGAELGFDLRPRQRVLE